MYAHSSTDKYNWKNWRFNIQRKRKSIFESLKQPEPCELVNNYTSQSSIHGLRYVSNVKANIIEKAFWVGALMICTLAACLLAGQLWKRYLTIPTVLVVKDTHLPLYLFPFPSITVCPANKVKKSVAMEYFSRYIDIEENKTKEDLLHVISAFSLMQQPTYFRMKPHVRKSQYLLPSLKDINVTDFMLTTLPTCSEVFAVCNWHGEEVNCCDVFSLQRTEEGFCYSFNSLTSEGGKHCPLSEVLENEGIVEEDDIMYEGCQLRRNTAVGTVTGLEVFVNKSNESETFGFGQKDLNGIRVIVHTSYEYPNAGDGIWVKEEQRKRVSITTYPYITVTSDNVKNLAIAKRGCVFPDEMDLHVYHVYTESSCLIECRLKYIASQCNCYMYYFPPPDYEKQYVARYIWNASSIKLDNFNFTVNKVELISPAYLRLQRPPENTPGFNIEDMRRSLNCSHCIPTCYETEHDLEVDYLADSHWLSRIYYGHLDVAYGNLGATKYQRDITFTWTDLLVSLGGVANLFLGFSLLSVVEFIYWLMKIALILMWKRYKRRQKLNKIIPLILLKYCNDLYPTKNTK